jgi:hypothetical protein
MRVDFKSRDGQVRCGSQELNVYDEAVTTLARQAAEMRCD